MGLGAEAHGVKICREKWKSLELCRSGKSAKSNNSSKYRGISANNECDGAALRPAAAHGRARLAGSARRGPAVSRMSSLLGVQCVRFIYFLPSARVRRARSVVIRRKACTWHRWQMAGNGETCSRVAGALWRLSDVVMCKFLQQQFLFQRFARRARSGRSALAASTRRAHIRVDSTERWRR